MRPAPGAIFGALAREPSDASFDHLVGGREQRGRSQRVRSTRCDSALTARQPYGATLKSTPKANEGARRVWAVTTRMSIFSHPYAIATSKPKAKCANCHHHELIIADLQALGRRIARVSRPLA
jgi:hypothetical protein